MYLINKDTYIKLQDGKATYFRGEGWFAADYRMLSGFPWEGPKFTGEELFKWLKDNGYRHMNEVELATYLLIT